MQMLVSDGRTKLTQEEIAEKVKRQAAEDEKEAQAYRTRMGIDRSVFSRDQERRADLHLQLSEKYMVYKDLAERAMINPQNIVKGDNRVFYIRPETVFLEDPRRQNAFRIDFLKQISAPPAPEPFTIMADQFQKAMIEDVKDQSQPTDVRHMLVKFFKRRQYKLQHKRYKYIQRWSHFALTSELVDKVSLKFSPNYSKMQFELENSVKRYQRLEGEDHFATTEPRPQRLENDGTIQREDLNAESLPKQSALRIDDMDVYNRLVTYEQKCSSAADKFVHKAKWMPMTRRFDVYSKHQQYFQSVRDQALEEQKAYVQAVQEKGTYLIKHRRLGETGQRELAQLVGAQQHTRREKKATPLIKDIYLGKAKYNYELPPMIIWNQIDLKLQMAELCVPYGINTANMEVDNGNSFSYAIIIQFPATFLQQVLKTQFAYVDSVPTKINPKQLAKKNIQKVLQRNMKKYGRTTGTNTLLELIEIKKQEENMKIEYINQVERSLFGQFNNGQDDSIEKVRLAKSPWIDWVCFRPELSSEQMQQAAFFAGDRNPVDECAANMLELINVNDANSVNLTLESLSQIQYEKLKHGAIKSDFLRLDRSESAKFFTEDQLEFMGIFSASLKTKSEMGIARDEIDVETVDKNSLFETTQHLLFAHYLLAVSTARESKAKLLYTLNAFRSIQKRLALDLREFGTRDRVMGDINYVDPQEKQAVTRLETDGDDSSDMEGSMGGLSKPSQSVPSLSQNKNSGVPQTLIATANAGDIDNVIQDEMVDINRFRYDGQLSNVIYSTCPIIPKYHTTFGEPIDRQEISAEFEATKDSDPKKGLAQNMKGRVDRIWLDEKTGCFIVTDDYDFNVMYDCTFSDMRALEQEILKMVSFYINRVEPMQDRDMRNIVPSVDRLGIVREALHWEELYQKAKLQLALQYMECYDHTCDSLEQQRLIQIVVDLLAKRPRMNLAANHFKDSYRAEIDALEAQIGIMKDFIRMQMHIEFRANNGIRELLEKTYRLIYEQMDNQWQEFPKQDIQDEKTKRQIQVEGVGGDDGKIEELKRIEREKPGMFQAKRYAVDPLQFAEMLGVPFSSLEMLMKQHHERDPIVKTTLHENVSFIKIQEGYPIFLYDTAVKAQNKVRLTEEGSPIGILDFYESLANLPRVVAALQHCCAELHDVHRPDNGFMSAALDVVTFQFLHAELKAVRAEAVEGDRVNSARDLDLLADDSILGNSDKMLFHMKELIAQCEDPELTQNPFVISKLDLKTVDSFDFQAFQGRQARKRPKRLETLLNDSSGPSRLASIAGEVADSASEEFSEGQYMEAMADQSEDDGDFGAKLKMQQNKADAKYPRLKAKKFRANMPSLLEISCNAVEVLRLRHLLVDALIQREDLSIVYRSQMEAMAKDGRINFKDCFNFSTFVIGTSPTGSWTNFVDSGPGLKTAYPTTLAITEFDPSMISCINFADPEAFKAVLCPLGLEELRVVYRYELMNLNMLIVAVQTNQVLLDNLQRQLAEMDLLVQGFGVSNPVNFAQEQLHEVNFKRLPDDRRNAAFEVQAKSGQHFYNIMNRKSRSRELIEKTFEKCRKAIMGTEQRKEEVLLRQMRTCRMQLAHDYCEEMTGAACLDTLKLELLHESNQMRRRAYLLPRDSMVHKLPAAANGEHQYANYFEPTNEEDDQNQKVLFYDEDRRRIQEFWAVPSFSEILQIESFTTLFKGLNHTHLYQFNYGQAGQVDEFGEPILPEFAAVDQASLAKQRLPKCTPLDVIQAEAQFLNHQRLVDFKECYSYSGSRALSQLYYLRQFQNLFDLEFFANKLPQHSCTIAGLEQSVLNGAPFWDDHGDAEDLSSGDEYLDNEQINDPMYADQHDGVDSPHRNQLALKVLARVAEEKRSKMKLLREIETIKEKFTEWERHMRTLELNLDLRGAAEFLNRLVQENYYALLLVFMSMQDAHGRDGTATKEMHQIRDVYRLLSHQEDQKVTYTNGFHVNHAVTCPERIPLDESVFRPDYENFFKACQPVIDEQALNPTEFTLLGGLSLARFTNNYAYRLDRRFTGHLPRRDFHFLDYKLLNIDTSLRKYIQTALVGAEHQAKAYACARLNTTERLYTQSNNLYREVSQERIFFNKQLIRSKTLKRALMVLMSKNALPVDKIAMKALLTEFHETFSWKVMTKMDEIDRQRQLAVVQDSLKRAKLERMGGDQVKATQARMQAQLTKKTDKESENILQQFDQATCEVDVFSYEISNYLILTGKRMIERESASLAKCFEMNGKRQQILIHPEQQFASTFDQAIDKKNHLDIINKVDAVQRMLTQFMNRCLPIETLTSGAGFTISAKDLNECLNELCRGSVKACEIEMRTRCEQLSMLILQYENLLYTKDMQLLNLESKLKHAKEELNKIINTKVFARGNNLIYELDMSTRQLRMMKDNVFSLEKGLKEKIRLHFDKDLEQTRSLLHAKAQKFNSYQLTLNSHMRENVTENINYIDEVMKARVEAFKEVHNGEDKVSQDKSAASTLGSRGHAAHLDNARRKQLMDKYAHLLKKGKAAFGELADPFGAQTELEENFVLIFEELERLKESEGEARAEVLKLEEYLCMSRMLQKLKESVKKQKHDYKIDNLRQQLSSNSVLWEQLAEAEKREKILKQELQKVQSEVAAQDKVLDRLRDEMKLEQIEKHKLIQFKTTKVKRLNHLEGMARQMELMQNIDLDKVIQTLSDKDKKLSAAMSRGKDSNQFMNEVYRVKAKEVENIKKDAQRETVLKESAIAKMEELRGEVELLKGDEETAYSMMRDEVAQLRRELQGQKEQNAQLRTALNSISTSAMPSPAALSASMMRHDDSVFSAAAGQESSYFFRQGNPFGDTKKGLIKKINTEAYLGVQPDAIAKFTQSQQPSLLNSNKRQTMQNFEQGVMHGPPKGDIGIAITPVKQTQLLQQHAAGKSLLKTLSDATMANSLQPTATASHTTKQPLMNLNHRSGEINNSLNSTRLKPNLRGQKGANLAFAGSSGQPSNNHDLNSMSLQVVASPEGITPHPYHDQMQLMWEQDPDNANNQVVLGGPLAKNTEMRQSYQHSPRSLMKASQRKTYQTSNVHNSVHLPSLRGQSQSFNSSKPSGAPDESLEAFRDPRRVREATTNKKVKMKKATDSNLGPIQNRQQLMQPNMLMSMQGPQNSLSLAQQFTKNTQSNSSLIPRGLYAESTTDIVMKGTHKPLNPMNMNAGSSPRSRRGNPSNFNGSVMQQQAGPPMADASASTSNSGAQTQSFVKRSAQKQQVAEENLFSTLISKGPEEAGAIYQQGYDLLLSQKYEGQKRVVFGKKPIHLRQMMPHMYSNESMPNIDQIEGGLRAGGAQGAAIQVHEMAYGDRNDSQPGTAQNPAMQSQGDSPRKYHDGLSYGEMEHEMAPIHHQRRPGNDSELVRYTEGETARTGQFPQEQRLAGNPYAPHVTGTEPVSLDTTLHLLQPGQNQTMKIEDDVQSTPIKSQPSVQDQYQQREGKGPVGSTVTLVPNSEMRNMQIEEQKEH